MQLSIYDEPASRLNPLTKSCGDTCIKNTSVLHTCVPHFQGLNPLPHALPLDLPWVLIVLPLQRQFPYLGSCLSVSELRTMLSKNQWTWMRRMCLSLQMNTKRGMSSANHFLLAGAVTSGLQFNCYWEGQFDDCS